MFNDFNKVNNKKSKFDIWYNDNFSYFARGISEFVEPTIEIKLFYKDVYCPTMHELASAIKKLLIKHYPVIDTEHRFSVLNAIQNEIKITGHNFLLRLYDLMIDHTESINLRDKYPELERWEIHKKSSKFINRSVFDSIKSLTYSQKNELYELAKKEFSESYNLKDQLRYEFIEVIQPPVFKYYPVIQQLDMDGWVVYFYLLSMEHLDYRLRFEHIAEFIEYKFPEEDLYIGDIEFQAKFQKKFMEKFDNETKKYDNLNK